MTQYLLSVYMTGDEAEMSEDEMQNVYAPGRQVQRRGPSGGCVGVRRWPPSGDQLRPSCSAKDGDVLTTDGPFAETKEQLGGFWVIEAADLDAALAWAAKGSAACMGAVEVRPFQDDPARPDA